MSYRDKYSSSSRHGHSSSRDSRPSRDRRSPSPASSSGRSSESSAQRGDGNLPDQFGKVASEKRPDDDTTVLQSMRKSFETNPLGCLTKCIKSDTKRLKVWTRNYKEIRGICTGTVIAFDKHWNMILKDVKEVYLKPKKAKTPFLIDEKDAKDFEELPPKEPKKKGASKAVEVITIKEEPAESDTSKPEEGEGAKKKDKKKKRKKRKSTIPTDRNTSLCFIRGDNIVMAAVVDVESEGED